MTNFLLIRHALTDAVNNHILTGRTPDAHLNERGAAQAKNLAQRLADLPIQAVYSSPLERAVETAEPIAAALNLKIEVLESLGEMDFGDWTGRNYDELRSERKWRNFNAFRSGTRIPNGELMIEAQTRIVRALERLREKHSDQTAAIVSHGDLIKAAIAHYVGLHLDFFQRVEISPASISVLSVSEENARLSLLNFRDEII